jgi:hypothetical protein
MLLILLLVAMAYATVYEAAHGTEQAQATFYKSWWFELLLWLLGANVLLSLLLRFPFSKRQIGFVITHLSILLILVGALVTKVFAVYGRVTLAEGQSASSFFDSDRDELMIVNTTSRAESSIELAGSGFHGFKRIEHPSGPVLTLDDVIIEVAEYAPDSRWERTAEDPEKSVVRVQYEGSQYEFTLGQCQKQPQAIGGTGLTVRVLRYLPHAQVERGGKLHNASDQPVNPAIEVEIVGPQGTDRRVAFSKFPDFQHGVRLIEDLHLTFVGGAGFQSSLVPVEPSGPTRVPAIRLAVTPGNETSDLWLQKHKSKTLDINGQEYELVYTTRRVPMDFDLLLKDFEIGRYPGSMMPRSYKSTVVITDQETGQSETREISMNRPTTFREYTFFQSGYQETGAASYSTLSVSRDPGLTIVFFGYVTLMGGTVVVLGIRIAERRKAQAPVRTQDVDHPATVPLSLAHPPTTKPEPRTA